MFYECYSVISKVGVVAWNKTDLLYYFDKQLIEMICILFLKIATN